MAAHTTRQIMVVEDDIFLREWMQVALEYEGYSVASAASGLQVFEMLARGSRPDLVLLDIMMPSMNGYEVCRRLRDHPATASTPIIFLTGMSSLEDKLAGFESGAVDYLTKPFKLEELKARIRALLRQGELERTRANAQVDREMSEAAAIQRSLMLQPIPVVEGLDIYATFRPARKVGGDLYDIHILPCGKVSIAEADVSGKGLPAALMMTAARMALRDATNHCDNVGEALSALDAALYADLTEVGRFLTIFLAMYDPGTRKVAYANGGHSVIVYLPVGQAPQILEAEGPPLGVLPDYPYVEQHLTLAPEDVLALCSDGFAEATNTDGDMFGYTRLNTVLQEVRHLSAREIADALIAAVSQFADGVDQFDDQTVVILKGTWQ